MAQTHLQFDQRVNNLGRKHQSMSRGYVTRMRPDGLIVARPYRTQSRFPYKYTILFFVALFVFKGFLIASLGPETYNERVGKLENGTVVEKVGAWGMQIEPVSSFVATKIGPVLR